MQSGRLARAYFDNLRADLAAARRAGVQPSLLDHDVPEAWSRSFVNFDPGPARTGVRYSLLSSVVPLFDEQVTLQPARPPVHRAARRPPPAHPLRARRRRVAGGAAARGAAAGPRGARGAPRRRVVRRRRRARRRLEWEPRPHLVGARLVAACPLPDRSRASPSGCRTTPGSGGSTRAPSSRRWALPAPRSSASASCPTPRPPTPGCVSASRPSGACACARSRSAPSIPPRPRWRSRASTLRISDAAPAERAYR